MPKFPIYLGRKMPEEMSMPEKMPMHKKSYPTLYLDWDKKYDLPDSGELTVKFVKTNENNSKDKNGEHQSVTLEIREICSVEGKESKKEEDDEEESGSEALDRLKKETDDSEDYD